MIETYILSNHLIKRILWLRDVRRDFDPLDEIFLEWTRVNNLPVSLVLTKADKASQSEITRAKLTLEKEQGIKDILLFSSKNGFGKSALVAHIARSIEDDQV